MHTPHRNHALLLFALIFLSVLSAGCLSGTAIPATDVQEQKIPQAVQETNNEADVPATQAQKSEATQTPPTANAPESQPSTDTPVFGYIDFSPAVFVQPINGLKIQVSEGTFSPQTGGLLSYKITVTYPTGAVNEYLFNDIAFNTNTGEVDNYLVSTEGSDTPGPSVEEFEVIKPELGPMIAFSLVHVLGEEPLPTVSVPCQGDSNVEFGQSQEGFRQVLKHEIKCGEQTYMMQYSDYSYDMQLGSLGGYTVVVEINP